MGYWVVPALVRSAYAGESFDVLNRVISGRGTHGVERYLDVARAFVNRATLGLAAGAVLLPVLWAGRPGLRRASDALVRGGAAGTRRELILAAAWLGLTLGFVEAALAWARFKAGGIISVYNNPDAFWMAPLAVAALFAVVATLAVAWPGRRGPVSYRIVLGGLGAFGFYGLIQGLELGLPPWRLGLHPAAVAVLALGLAIQVVRWVDARPGARRLMRVSVLPMAALFVLLPLITGALGSWRHGRQLAALGPETDRPNIILLVLDTVRKESMALHGYGRPNTPVLDELAEASAVFERGIATSSWTLPTHASLFTGRYQYELSADRQQPLDDTWPTLAEFLGENGYATGGFVANLDYTTRSTGLARGFMRYRDHRRTFGTWALSAWLPREVTSRIWRRLPTERQGITRKYAPIIVDELEGWLDDVGDRPFFAFLNMYDAHAPYEIHEEYLATFPGERPITEVRNAEGVAEPLTRDLAAAIDGYDTGIAMMDEAIGRMIAGLEARGLDERTIIIITSDHGEHLGDHGLMDHHNSLYSQLVLVPLIVHVPGETPELRVEAPASLRDIPATIVDLTGLGGGPFPGRSLRRHWTGGSEEPDFVLAELSAAGNLGEDDPDEPIGAGPMKSLVEGSLHYILNGDGTHELYDLATDEGEYHDLAGVDSLAARLPAMRARLEAIARVDTLVYSDAYRRAGR